MSVNLSPEAIRSLAAKLDAADLTPEEQVVLGQLLIRASSTDEVSGFQQRGFEAQPFAGRAGHIAIGLGLPAMGSQHDSVIILVPDDQGRVE